MMKHNDVTGCLVISTLTRRMNSGLPPGVSNGPAACKLSCELCPKSSERTSDGKAIYPNDRPTEYPRTPTSLGFGAQGTFREADERKRGRRRWPEQVRDFTTFGALGAVRRRQPSQRYAACRRVRGRPSTRMTQEEVGLRAKTRYWAHRRRLKRVTGGDPDLPPRIKIGRASCRERV